MTLILKNTFLDIAEPEVKVHARRCSSIPPAWKPLDPHRDLCDCDGDGTLPSDVSTPSNWSAAESDDESLPRTTSWFEDSDTRDADDVEPIPEYNVEERESVASDTPTCASGKMTLCLDATVESTIGALPVGMKTKLSSKALAFAPQSGIGDEILQLIQRSREVLQSSPDVLSVKVSEGIMGGTTTLLAEVRRGALGGAILGQTASLLKATLLNTAAESESTYIVGYKSQPFQDSQDGFKATIGCVNSLQEHSVCWDTYELGYCPRRRTCRWCHPLPKDLMQVVVMLKECDYCQDS